MRASHLGKILLICFALCMTVGCNKLYYNMMESVAGKHKRDIMVDRVEEARGSQEEAKEQFKTTIEKFKEVTNFQGGSLEDQYNTLNSHYEKSKSRADDVNSKISAIEDVSGALFSEWKNELQEYSSDELRRDSEKKLQQTEVRYEQMIKKMRAAAEKMDPVLVTLHDQVLYLKHNLNAAAISSLEDNVLSLETDVNNLIREMEASIDEANKFIDELESGKS